MNFRNISAWSIRNPVIPLVAFTALLLAGCPYNVSDRALEVARLAPSRDGERLEAGTDDGVIVAVMHKLKSKRCREERKRLLREAKLSSDATNVI